jgi:hypothetical protein
MRVKLCVCDVCGASMEDDGFDWFCTGEPGAAHRRAPMRHAEFVEAGDLERQLAALLDALEGEEEIRTPAGPFFLEGLRRAYEEAQWSSAG